MMELEARTVEIGEVIARHLAPERLTQYWDVLMAENLKVNLVSRETWRLISIRNVSRETTRKRTSEEDPDAVRLTQRLGERLGTRVKLSGSVRKGKLEIEYYSTEDLDRILEIILGSE